MFHHPIIFPATKENKIAIQRARELINVVYPLQAGENESVNEERKQLLTKLNSLDSRLLTFQEKKDLEALINRLTRRVAGMKSISNLSHVNVSKGARLQVGDFSYVENQHNHVTVLGQPINCSAEKLSETLKQKYLGFKEIKGLFGKPFALEREYINLQMICHTEVEEEKNQGKEKKLTNNGRLSSYEDLFGDKRVIKPEDLFKSDHDLFPHANKKNSASPTLLLIQGRAGIGKTTFLHYVSREWAQGKLYSQYRWVFKLTCRELRSSRFKAWTKQAKQLALWEWVYHSQFNTTSINGKEFRQLWLKDIDLSLQRKEVLFCIDGYDELPEHHPCEKALEELLEGAYSGVHKIITSRPYGVAELPKERRDIEVIGFTDENITRYLQTYFPSASFAKQLRDDLKQNLILWGIAHIPVNLNLICGIMEQMQQEDHQLLQRKVDALGSLSQLYQAMEAALAERSYLNSEAETKGFKELNEEAQQEVVKERYHHAFDFLAYLAYEGLRAEQGGLILSNKKVGEARVNYMKRLKLLPKEEANHFKKAKKLGFLKPILNEEKVARRENSCDYEFIHLTFQEYYAAKHIVAGMKADQAQRDQMKLLIIKERYNPRWQIVWWFIAGLLRQDDETYAEYIRLLQAQDPKKFLTGDLLQHYGLGLLARCLDEGLATNEKILPIMNESIKLLQASVKSLYLCAQRMNTVISSALIESLRLSPRLLLLPEKKDLYSQIDLEGDTPYGKESIRSIGQIRVATPKVLGYLAKQLANSSQAIRQKAADAVCDIGSAAATKEILAELAKLLSDDNRNIRRSAADAVSGLGPAAAAPGFLAQLAKLLSDNNGDVRWRAADAVYGIGPAAATSDFLAQLVKLLSDENDDVRENAAYTVNGLGSAAATKEILAQLANLLSDKNDEIRMRAAVTINGIGPAATTREILAQLAKLLSDDNDEVRRRAADAVNGIGSKAATPAILTQFVKLLSDDNFFVRWRAAEAVRGIGSAAATPAILEQLAKLLSDDNCDVRRHAAVAVCGIGSAAATPEILAQLAKLLSNEKDEARKSAAEAVRSIGSAAAKPAILAQLDKFLSDENDGYIHWRVAVAVSGLGSAAAKPAILAQLAKLLSDENYHVRWYAAYAISGLGSAAATPEILAQLDKLLSNENDSVRWSASETVRSIGPEAATPTILRKLINLLKDPDEYIYRSAAAAIRGRGSKAATPEILAQLAKLLSDDDYKVRWRAAKAVGDIGSEAAKPEIFNQLLKLMLTDPHKHWSYITQVLSTLIPAIFTDTLQQWIKQSTDFSPSDTVDINLVSAIIGAYLTGHISCQVAWDADKKQYMVSGFVHIQDYSIPINKQQAQGLCRTVPRIIEQLSQGNISDALLLGKLNTNHNSSSYPSNSSHISQQNNLYSNKEQVSTLFNQTQKQKYSHHSISTIEATAAPSSRVEVDVPASGDCLFWAAALALLLPRLDQEGDFKIMYQYLFGTKAAYKGQVLERLVCQVFRQRVIDNIEECISLEDRRNVIAVDHNNNWEDYKYNMLKPGTWGGEAEIKAISRLARTNITVYGKGYKRDYDDPSYCNGRIYLIHTQTIKTEGAPNNHYHYELPEELYNQILGHDTKQLSNKAIQQVKPPFDQSNNTRERVSNINTTIIEDIVAETKLALGSAYSKRDCFFDAIAQGLEDKGIQIPGNSQCLSYKKLRLLCDAYIKNPLNKNWVKEEIGKIQGSDDFQTCSAQIQYTHDEIESMKVENPSLKRWYATRGRPSVEGRIICSTLGEQLGKLVNLHVIDIHAMEEVEKCEHKALKIHWLINSNGQKAISEQDVNYEDENTIHIINYKNRFVPLLKNKVLAQENHHRELKLLPKASEEALATAEASLINTYQILYHLALLKRADKKLIRAYSEIMLRFLGIFEDKLTEADKDKIKDKINGLIKELGGEELCHEHSRPNLL